jgi:catechol 2,3-dioxygenase-like lactoylglutathione lyase family enzyme
MDKIVDDLVARFERGALSRRQLIQGLTMLAAAGGTAPVAAQNGLQTPFSASGIDHISVQVTDLERSMAFYTSVFGLRPLNEDRDNRIVRMGVDRIIVSLHAKPPTGIVDHFAIAIDGFDQAAATQALEALNLQPQTNLDYGFHVRDPEGIPVQIVAG